MSSILHEGCRFRRAILALVLALVAVVAAPAQEIPSALPSIGRLLDIRDVKTITAGDRELVWTASHVYETSTKYFDAEGNRKPLPLDQAIRRHVVPVFATYGLGNRWSVGAGASLVNDLQRKLAVLNLTAGASILGQPLAVGQVTTLETEGSGVGDLSFFLQHQPDWFGKRLTSLVALDVVAPTAESNPTSALDMPIGQGNWTYRLSWSGLREIYPMTWFAKLTYENNRAATGRDLTGTAYEFDRGDGLDATFGAGYAIGESFTLLGQFAASWRDQGSRSDRTVPTPFTRSAQFRPGYSFRSGEFVVTQQLEVPISGRNILSTQGFMTTVEYRF